MIARHVTELISRAVEITAAVIVGIALLKTIVSYIVTINHPIDTTQHLRIRFGSSVSVALELLLAADVLATAIAPDWNDLAKLAAIAVLRTGLNYFLEKELQHLRSADIKPSK